MEKDPGEMSTPSRGSSVKMAGPPLFALWEES